MLAAMFAARPLSAEMLFHYQSPKDASEQGDFEFRYSANLIVQQDYVYAEATTPGPRHTIVLRHRDAEDGDLRVIEINGLRSLRQKNACEDYDLCKVVDGVVIGTDCLDPDFRPAFDEVVRTFRKRG